MDTSKMDETHIKISGEWKYLYRAVDRARHTIEFLTSRQEGPRCSEAILRPRDRLARRA